MRTLLAIGIVAAAALFAPSAVQAQERKVGNAAMGAVAGAVVLGPIGLLAGGAIGYTAGENIARGMGIKRKRTRHVRKAKYRQQQTR